MVDLNDNYLIELTKQDLINIIKTAYMAGFGQGTAENIGTTNALEKAEKFALFSLSK